MGKIVMKEAPDVDYYVEWSSVVEAPTFGGGRVEMLEHLTMYDQPQADPRFQPEARLQRADETGTSSMWVHAQLGTDRPEEGAWDDWGQIYMQQGLLDRPNIFVLTRRIMESKSADATDLLRPFEDSPAT